MDSPGLLIYVRGKMEEICASIFGPAALSSHRVRSNFISGPAEKSAVLTVAMLLARNVFHIGGTVAVPLKCRLTQIGKFISVCVRVWKNILNTSLAGAIYSTGWEPKLMFMY